MEVVLLAIGLVGIAFLGLGVNIFFRKTAFPETEVGKNRDMKRLGITCAKCEERRIYKEAVKKHAAKHIQPATLKLDIPNLNK